MKVLHVNVSAICDKFYLTLFSYLKNEGITQTVYCPYSKRENADSDVTHTIEKYREAKIELSLLPIKKNIDRLLYSSKIQKYSSHILNEIDNNKYDIIHAHSLYTDGGTAFLLSKKLQIPYIVAVRGADTTAFMKYYRFLAPFARKILENASKVVFISPDLKRITLEYLYRNSKTPNFLKNSVTIPNGVDRFWLSNEYRKSTKPQGIVNIIQVGRLVKYKNTDKSILAVKKLHQSGIDVTLNILGKGPEEDRLRNLIQKNDISDSVNLIGFVSDRQLLLEHYRNSDIFLLPSNGETFGIAYIEAMTQGLPVIGLCGSGVSGYLADKQVGQFIKDAKPETICDAVKACINNYSIYSRNTNKEIYDFDWNGIIRQYSQIYSEIK